MKVRRALVRLDPRVPGLYSLLAFVTGKRIVVRGRSMIPALSPGERVLFDRLAYVRGKPRVGDIVLGRDRVARRVGFARRDVMPPTWTVRPYVPPSSNIPRTRSVHSAASKRGAWSTASWCIQKWGAVRSKFLRWY